jgi:hypothetical protein
LYPVLAALSPSHYCPDPLAVDRPHGLSPQQRPIVMTWRLGGVGSPARQPARPLALLWQTLDSRAGETGQALRPLLEGCNGQVRRRHAHTHCSRHLLFQTVSRPARGKYRDVHEGRAAGERAVYTNSSVHTCSGSRHLLRVRLSLCRVPPRIELATALRSDVLLHPWPSYTSHVLLRKHAARTQCASVQLRRGCFTEGSDSIRRMPLRVVTLRHKNMSEMDYVLPPGGLT